MSKVTFLYRGVLIWYCKYMVLDNQFYNIGVNRTNLKVHVPIWTFFCNQLTSFSYIIQRSAIVGKNELKY